MVLMVVAMMTMVIMVMVMMAMVITVMAMMTMVMAMVVMVLMNSDGDLHLDVVDDARLKIDTDSSWNIIAMVTLVQKTIINIW